MYRLIAFLYMCKTTFTRANKPFEATTSQYRSSIKVVESLIPDRSLMYRSCLEQAIKNTAEKEENKYRKDDFFRDAKVRVNLLMDAKPMQDWCAKNKLDLFSTSTHIVMKGITAIKRVLCDDIINEGKITLEVSENYNIPIFTREDLGMEDETSLTSQEAS